MFRSFGPHRLPLARGLFSALVVHPAPTFELFWGQPGIRPHRPNIEFVWLCTFRSLGPHRLPLPRGPFSASVVYPAPTFESFWGQPRIRPHRRPAELSLSLSSVKNFSFQEVLSSNHNSLMHSLNGNTTTLRLVWEGSALIARRVLSLDTLLQPHLSSTPSPPQPYHSIFTREYLLSQRSHNPTELQAKAPPKLMSRQDLLTTPPVNVHTKPKQCSRTGRRIKLRVQGFTLFLKGPKHRSPRIKGIKSNSSNTSRTPPPRGTPGIQGSNEECPHTGGGTTTQSKGSLLRAFRRRAYRAWVRQCRQTRGRRVGALSAVPSPPTKAAPTRASWFRRAVLWQQQLGRNKRRKVTNKPTTPPLDYQSSIRAGSLNVQGFAETLKLKSAIDLMQTHNLDVLFLSETRTRQYYSYLSEQHLVILSGNHLEPNAGVGAIVSPRLRPHLSDVIQLSPRILHLFFKKKGGNMHLLGVYAPHSGLDFEQVRQPFWEQLEDHIAAIPQPEPVYVVGDFNVRFQATHKHDNGVTGPYTYGKGPRFIDHTATSNRSLCIKHMSSLNMVEAASYKTPTPKDHITYRDKAAPPADWSQFVLDPMILQQFYSKLTTTFEGDVARQLGLQIRSYLDLPTLLQAPLPPPSPDPVRFQRLDHCFVRSQWLPSVLSCKSKLYTGYPSDHYLVVSEFKAKLKARPKQPPRHQKLEPPTQTQLQHYNQLLHHPQAQQHNTDHTAEPQHFYTDGSGTKGRCSAHTAAGWGWTLQGEEDDWLDASGPVITSSDHTAFLGAEVGSNNTGELSAIYEALLFAAERHFDHTVIHSDSQWSINVITGRWRPKAHKNMINRIRALLRNTRMRVHFQWVKGHQGCEGNERADRLAEAGKESQERTGGRTLTYQPVILPHSDHTATPDRLVTQMLKAASTAFSPSRFAPRTPWITTETLEKLRLAKQAIAEGATNAKQLLNHAKRQAKKDRVKWVHDQLLADPVAEHSTVWRTAKRQKQGFRGRKQHLVIDGKPVPWSRTHEAIRDNLQERNQPADPQLVQELQNRPQLRPQLPGKGEITLEELQTALTKLKKNKAPGPDSLSNEFLLWLDENGEQHLLTTLQGVWDEGKVPDSWKHAAIVTIYKGKGLDTDPQNYRPIALLNTMYKVFASIIQNRLAQDMDQFLRKSQYGFRAAKGTKHALHILRRAMEYSNLTDTNLNLLFLDWKQAFDSVDHTALKITLQRFGIPADIQALVNSIYSDPTFEIKGLNGKTVN